jgi:hypothetical protein
MAIAVIDRIAQATTPIGTQKTGLFISPTRIENTLLDWDADEPEEDGGASGPFTVRVVVAE